MTFIYYCLGRRTDRRAGQSQREDLPWSFTRDDHHLHRFNNHHPCDTPVLTGRGEDSSHLLMPAPNVLYYY